MAAVQTLHTSNMTYNLLNINNNNNTYVNNNSLCAMIPANMMSPIKTENNVSKKCSKRMNFGTNSVTHHQPASVARRNARERNRVKQVNNGFATLRQHIPTSIIATSTSSSSSSPSATSNRSPSSSSSKKLSKVETLRLAVEYIRCLQQLLEDSENDSTNSYVIDNPNDNYTYQAQVELMQQLQQSPNSSLSPVPSTYSSNSSSPLSTDNSLNFNYLTNTQSILYQQPPLLPLTNVENFENYQPTSPEDEELLDAISWWQQQ